MKQNLLMCMLFAAGLALCSGQPLCAQAKPAGDWQYKSDPKALPGKWFLALSNGASWTKEDISGVTITYAGTGDTLKEEIHFRKKGKESLISATDIYTSHNHFNRQAKPGGKGEWYNVAMDENKEWVILYFEKSGFSKAFMQVISRNPTLSEKGKASFDKLCKENYFIGAQVKTLKVIKP